MSLVIRDFRQIAAILADPLKATPKRTHRWPSGQDIHGNMRSPKMRAGVEHSVYEQAPHGRYGNPMAPPLVVVKIMWIKATWPYEWTDEEMPYEGFASVEAYGTWWDRTKHGHNHYKPWPEMVNEPFWVCWFEPVGKTEYYTRRAEMWAKENGLL